MYRQQAALQSEQSTAIKLSYVIETFQHKLTFAWSFYDVQEPILCDDERFNMHAYSVLSFTG